MRSIFTTCACRRPHLFIVGPGIHRRRCGCGNFVTVHVLPPSRWSMLEID